MAIWPLVTHIVINADDDVYPVFNQEAAKKAGEL